MSEKNLNLTRRKFMVAGSAAIAAPFVMKMTGTVPHVEAAEKEAEPQWDHRGQTFILDKITSHNKLNSVNDEDPLVLCMECPICVISEIVVS